VVLYEHFPVTIAGVVEAELTSIIVTTRRRRRRRIITVATCDTLWFSDGLPTRRTLGYTVFALGRIETWIQTFSSVQTASRQPPLSLQIDTKEFDQFLRRPGSWDFRDAVSRSKRKSEGGCTRSRSMIAAMSHLLLSVCHHILLLLELVSSKCVSAADIECGGEW
jgi:hypothetical protein